MSTTNTDVNIDYIDEEDVKDSKKASQPAISPGVAMLRAMFQSCKDNN